MEKVVSKVKEILKGASRYFNCTYSTEWGRITIDFNRHEDINPDGDITTSKLSITGTKAKYGCAGKV